MPKKKIGCVPMERIDVAIDTDEDKVNVGSL